MLSSAPIITFLATTDRARAHEFYEKTIGLKFVLDEPYALVFDLNGIMLRISPVPQFTPAGYTVLGWTVADILSEIADLVARGIVFEKFPGMPQDEDGVMTFPNGDKVAWFKDPDGNILSLTQWSTAG